MSSTAVRRSVRMSVVAVVVALTSLVVTDRADAHAGLVSSTPADGQTITEPLDRVALTFSEAPLAGLDAGLRVEVRDADGTDVSTGDVVVDGATMSKAVDPQDGDYTLLWRYVSPDGHPITGELAFAVDLPAVATTPTPSTSATAEPGDEATEMDVTLDATPVPTAEDTPSTLPVLIAGGAGILLVAAVLVLASRRGRAPSDD